VQPPGDQQLAFRGAMLPVLVDRFPGCRDRFVASRADVLDDDGVALLVDDRVLPVARRGVRSTQ